jgi:hypothetical protein
VVEHLPSKHEALQTPVLPKKPERTQYCQRKKERKLNSSSTKTLRPKTKQQTNKSHVTKVKNCLTNSAIRDRTEALINHYFPVLCIRAGGFHCLFVFFLISFCRWGKRPE